MAPDTQSDRSRFPSWTHLLKWGLPLGLLLVFLSFYHRQVAVALSPFLIAFLLAYILDPVVVFVQEGRLPIGRLGAVIIIYLVIIAVVITVLAIAVPRLARESQELAVVAYNRYFPRLRESVEGWIGEPRPGDGEPAPAGGGSGGTPDAAGNRPGGEVGDATGPAPDAAERSGAGAVINTIRKGGSIIDAVLGGVRQIGVRVAGTFSGFVGSVLNAGLSLVILFYLLVDLPDLKERFRARIPDAHREKTLRILRAIDGQLSAYLRGQLTVCVIVGALVAAGLWVVGMVLSLSIAKYALLIGVTAGVFNLVPYLGPVMGATPAVILTIADIYDPGGEGMWTRMAIQVGAVIGLFVLVQLADGFFISPRIMSGRLALHPLVIMFALILGGAVGGFVGMILAVPAACLVRTLVVELCSQPGTTRGT